MQGTNQKLIYIVIYKMKLTCMFITVYVALTLVSWSHVMSEMCPTHVLCVFLRIFHVSACRVHFNIIVFMQHR